MTLPTDSERERLALLAEECAEVQQIIMKILRHGYESYNPFDKNETTNRKLLEIELGHVEYAIELMLDSEDITGDPIVTSQEKKMETIQQWLHFNRP